MSVVTVECVVVEGDEHEEGLVVTGEEDALVDVFVGGGGVGRTMSGGHV